METNTKPIPTDPYENIPAELREKKQWIIWKLEEKTETYKGRKTPYQIKDPHQKALTTKPDTWGFFGAAKSTAQMFNANGIGFVFIEEQGIIAGDADNHEVPGTPEYAQAEENIRLVIETLKDKTYLETSVSGLGIHFLVKGTMPAFSLKGIEVYNSERYFAMTGNFIGNCKTINECPTELEMLYTHFKKDPDKVKGWENPEWDKHKPTGRSLSIGDTCGLRVEDIGYPAGNPKKSGANDIVGAHPFHGSTSGYNYAINPQKNVWICRRDGHNCGGDALTLFAVKEGIINCEDARPGCLEGKWVEVFAALKKAGYKVPDKPLQGNTNGKVTNPSMIQFTPDEFAAHKKQENPSLTVNLPDSIVSQYIEYMQHLSDGFSEFQLAGIIAILSSIINRKAYLNLNVGTIYTNVWVFILGMSTISRKTTACKTTEDFIESVAAWTRLSYPGSVEAFIEILEGETRVRQEKDKGHGILIKDEAAGLLAGMQKTYMNDMRDTLCDFYECKFFSRALRSSQRKSKTSFTLNEPYLNLFLATTPDNFGELTTTMDLSSGWLLRFLYFYPTYHRKLRDKTERTTGDENRRANLITKLIELNKFFAHHEVNFCFTPSGRKFYNDWERAHVDAIQKSGTDDRGGFDRLSVYALKLAMIYTVSQDSFIGSVDSAMTGTVKKTIDDACLKESCRQVDEFFLPTARVVFDIVGHNEEKNHIEKVKGIMTRNGGKITRTNLLKRSHLKKYELDDSLEALLEGEVIGEGIVEGKKCYFLK